MIRISRLFTFALSLLVLGSAGFAQDRERGDRPNRQQGNRQNLSPEEWKQQQVEAINKNVEAFMKKMGKDVPEDKTKAVSGLVAQHQIGAFKIRMEMMAARQKIGNDRSKMQNLQKAVQDKMKKLTDQTKAQAKEILENKVARKFNKTLDELAPQSGAGGRGGQAGGRGGRGGGGGGGGGGRG